MKVVRILNGSLSLLTFLVIGAVTSASPNGSTSEVAFASCPGPVEWQKAFGGLPNSQNQIRQTSEGGFVLGSTVTGSRGFDYRIVRIDAHGNQLWEKVFGGSAGDHLTDLQLTSDGGYILGGESFSPPDGEKTAPGFGDADYWVVRLDAAGNKLWDRSYGGANWDVVFEMQQTSDGGFVLGGTSASPPGGSKSSVNFGSTDFWLVRIDAANGNQLWDRSYGGSDVERWGKAQQTRDGGFVLVGSSASGANGNKTTPAIGAEDGWIVRTDAAGNKLWDQTYGSSLNDFLQQGVETGDGGVMAAGWTEASGRAHGWALQLNVDGTKRWERFLGGSGDDLFRAVTMLAGGGFALGGMIDQVAWLVRLDDGGNTRWERTIGEPSDSIASLRATSDNGLVLASDFGRVIKLGPEQERCDSDGDGVPDALDECPNTTGGPVNVRGCSLPQLCPCEGPWTNHGQYVNCVTRNAGDFYREGLITADERRNMVRAAGSSPCD